MDGVFMKKFVSFLLVCVLIAGAFWLGTVIEDRQTLRECLIRLHVVGASDSQEDQEIKLLVRDAITQKLETVMAELPDMETAKAYIQDHLPELETVANNALEAAGSVKRAVISLTEEAFPLREYDTFALPAGIYESLRVTIGQGEGKNWWCVVFPRLCVSATAEGFEDTAVSAGFSNQLAGALSGEPKYQVRFFLLDCLGWVENLFHKA